MIRKKIRIIGAVVAVSLILSSGLTPLAANQDQINQNNNKINDLQNQRDGISGQSAAANSELQAVMDKVNAKNEELTASSAKVQAFQEKIDSLQGEIDDIEKNLADMEQQIKENEIKQSEQEKMLNTRLRSYYKSDMAGQIIYVILKSQSLTDLFTNIDNVSKIMSMDQDLIKEINELKETLSSKMDELNTQKTEIEEKKQEQVDAQKQYLDEKNKYEAEMAELKDLESQKQSVVDSLSQKDRDLMNQIGDLNSYNDQLQSEIDNLYQNIGSGSGTSSSSEGYIMPASGYISSPYGPRVHPITGANGFHTGIDIAAGSGQPIVAAKSGTVVFAGVQSGYGNVIIVDHGGGMTTLYAHCSVLVASYGQSVSQGQLIAKVGSTGNSTGPHLHFEVRINGQHTNPMNYL